MFVKHAHRENALLGQGGLTTQLHRRVQSSKEIVMHKFCIQFLVGLCIWFSLSTITLEVDHYALLSIYTLISCDS